MQVGQEASQTSSLPLPAKTASIKNEGGERDSDDEEEEEEEEELTGRFAGEVSCAVCLHLIDNISG